jgi:hypothetical protein
MRKDPADQMKRGERDKPEDVKVSVKFSFKALKGLLVWLKRR